MRKLFKHFLNLRDSHLFCPSNTLRAFGAIFKTRAFTGPLKIVIDITNRCDMGCRMCWYHSCDLKQANSPELEITKDKFSEIAKEAAEMGAKIIMLCGEGEPFMHKDIFSLIRIARHHGLDVEIMTSALHLDEKSIKQILDYRVRKILVSLHCADKETFKKIRPLRNETDYEKIIHNLHLLQELKEGRHPLLYIINVISSLNADKIKKMTLLANQLNADKVLFKPLSLTSELDPSLIPSEIQRIKSNIVDNTNGFFALSKKHPGKKEDRSSCYIPWTQVAIGMNGDCFSCAYNINKPMGNIYESSLSAIWNGENYRTFRKNPHCPRKCLGRAVYPLLPI